MEPHRPRREFVKGLAALTGSGWLSAYMRSAAAEPAPVVTTIKIHENSLSCVAAQLIAGELMHAEGFTDVKYVNYPRDIQHWPPEDLLAGEVDITYSFPPTDVRFIDAGAPVARDRHYRFTTLLGASHARRWSDQEHPAEDH